MKWVTEMEPEMDVQKGKASLASIRDERSRV